MARTEPVDVPVLDLIDVVYAVPGSLRIQQSKARTEELRSVAPDVTGPERLRAIERAIKEYEILLVQGEQNVAGRRRDVTGSSRSPGSRPRQPAKILLERKPPSEALTAFLRPGDSWQTVPATNLLARLLMNEGKPELAGEAFRQVAKTRDQPPEFRREVIRLEIYWDLLGKDIRAASAALSARET